MTTILFISNFMSAHKIVNHFRDNKIKGKINIIIQVHGIRLDASCPLSSLSSIRKCFDNVFIFLNYCLVKHFLFILTEILA
jgi:hypothetical protein